MKGFKNEQLGSGPLTVWVGLNESPVTFDLYKPIPWRESQETLKRTRVVLSSVLGLMHDLGMV